MSRKERHFPGIARDIRNFSENKYIWEYCFVSNNFVSEGMFIGSFLSPEKGEAMKQ